jgi:hypothetical protein
MDEQDPKRREMQAPIPTHPPDPAERGDEEKVVGSAKPASPNESTLHSVGLAPGAAIDAGVGGPGLGQAPQDDNAAGVRDQQTRTDADRGRTG